MVRRLLLVLLCAVPAAAQGPSKLPTGVILIKGAEPSASDAATPLPESGRVAQNVYRNDYFGLTYPLAADWSEDVQGPPPSESGMYVLEQLVPGPAFKGADRGSILITAHDLFFTLLPAASAKEMIQHTKDALPAYYKEEHAPADVRIGGRAFSRFDYNSPVAGLHWYVLATEIRCHAVQFVFTSRDAAMLDRLVADMNRIQFAGDSPVCIADYASGANVISRVDPVLTDRKYNAIPVRITIDKEGKVKHVHVISAFAEQAQRITPALLQWRFKPYLQDGRPVEVETGIMFGNAPPRPTRRPGPWVTAGS